jgi:hypothetical protein
MHILFDADWTFLSRNYLNADELWVDNKILQSFFKEAFPPTVTNQADLMEVLSPYLSKMWREKSVEEFIDTWFTSQNTIREWMNIVLKDSQDWWHICSLCTQQEKYRSKYMKEDMWFWELFDTCYFTSELWFTKKDPKFFETIIVKSWIKAEHTIFIDDKISYCDIAKEIWVQTYHFDGDVQKLRDWLVEKWVL